MSNETYEVLGLSLLVHSGPHFRLGDVELLVSIDAIGLEIPQLPERTRVCVVARDRDGSLVESRPFATPHEIAHLVSALRGVAFPARAPALEAIVDTSDGWERLRLHVRLDGTNAAMELHLQSSGFSGRDAQAWRAVFHTILRIADRLGEHPTPPWARVD